MRRWLSIIFLVVLVVLAAGATAVQVLFSTDIPRRLVLDALQEQTGLQYQATALQTGWGGSTVLRELTITLPMHRDPVLHIPTLALSHTDLVRLVIFRDPILNEVTIEQPQLWLRQDAQGQWNLLEAANIVEQHLATDEPTTREMQPLPELKLSGATVHILDVTGRHITYGPIDVRGEAVDALSWRFTLALQHDVLARGRLAPRSNWAHQIDFDLQEIQCLVAPWVDQQLPLLQAAGNWQGRIEASVLDGTLQLDPLRFNETTLAGDLAVRVVNSDVTIQPGQLSLAGDDPQHPTASIRSGTIDADLARQSLQVANVLVRAFDIDAQVNGGWTLTDEAAWAQVRWSGILEELSARHDGHLDARLEMPRVGWHVLTANIRSQGSTPEAQWDTRWDVIGRGESWRSISGSLSAPVTVVHTQGETVDLSGITARFAAQWPRMQLTRLDLPGTVTRSRGEYDADTGQWALHFAAQQWRVPGIELLNLGEDEQAPLLLDVQLQAGGTAQQVQLDVLNVSSTGSNAIPGFEISAGGIYDLANDIPLTLRAIASTTIEQDALRADVRSDLALTGSFQPFALLLDGIMHLSDASWEGRAVDELTVPLRAEAYTDRVTFQTADFTLLDGQWRIDGRYDVDSRFAQANLLGSDISLQRVVRFIDVPVDLAGTLSSRLHIELPNLDFDSINLQGQWELDQLVGEGLHAAAGRGDIDYIADVVRLQNMQFQQDEGVMTGRAELDLQRVQQLVAQLQVADWDVMLPEYATTVKLNGSAKLDVDLAQMVAAQGSELAMTFHIERDDQSLGELDVRAALQGRSAMIEQLVLTGMGGRAEGSGTVHLTAETWRNSTFDLAWWDVDLARLPLDLAIKQNLVGIATGTLRVAESRDTRAPEPLQVDLVYELTDAGYGPMTLNDGFLTGYLGPDRFMIQESRFEMIGGFINLWGRMTEHDGQSFAHVHLELNEIDLQQLAEVVGYTEYPMPGRINGEGTAGGYFQFPHRLFGQSTLRLTESDIASAPGIAQLYSAANIDFGRPEPSGEGEMIVRLENNAIDIARLTYFNRGMDVVARARVLDLWQGRDSPIVGLAAGTVRPLRDTHLPFLGDRIDRLLTAIQADAISVRVNGSVGEPEVALVPLAEVTGAIGRILRGRVD